MKIALPIILLLSVTGFSQNLPEAMENQCRSEAKEIALKSYESCISVKKTEQIENLRKEYQARLIELKNEYDQKIKDLATATESTEPVSQKSQPTPPLKTKSSQNAKSKSMTKKGNSSASLNQTEPTIKLKKAKPVAKTKKRALPAETALSADIESQQAQWIQEEVMTAKAVAEEEMNSVTGETEKLEVQDVEQ